MNRSKPSPPAMRFPANLKFGFRGVARLAETLTVVSPRLLKLLIGRRRPTAREVREIFEELGTTYIKLGQFIASAPSIFPADYVEEFQKCLDKTPTIPFKTVVQIIEKEFLCDIDELFASIEPKALASASIAQVHAATLHSGEDVVVKVQKPGVESIISTDLNVVFVMTRLLELITPGLSREAVSGFVSEIYQYMIDECDFIKEANNLRKFNAFLQTTNNFEVVAPAPFEDVSSKKVLTMERFYGVSLVDYDMLQNYTDSPGEVLITAMNTWFSSIMGCEFFHADLHSGNLMLLKDGRIGFIDFGMIGRIQPETWRATFQLFEGLSSGNASVIASAMLVVGMTDAEVDVAALTEDIERLFITAKHVSSPRSDVLEDDINTLLLDLGQLARTHGMRFPHAFTLLIKQFLYFDRYIHLLMPELDLFDDERINMLAN